VKARDRLARAHAARAEALDLLHRHADAVKAWEQAIELDDGRNKARYEHRRTQSLHPGA
jgi:predicted RNA polymerase sigma factor